MSLLEDYVSFLPIEGQTIIATLRQEAQEPLSVLAGIHWIAHHPRVDAKLSILIIIELNKIITSLNSSNYSTINVKSAAALTLTPDRCHEECFGNWEDYSFIQSLIPILEKQIGRPMVLRSKPEIHLFKPALWRKLQSDSFYRKTNYFKNAN